jgi:transposase
MLPVSRDTLLRVLRRRSPAMAGAVQVIGIDDFAWKRGQRYGTVVCDLEHRRIIDLLPDREAATVAAWLAAHPEITVVSRDRGAGYGRAASQGAPQAVQVAGRWHLMENASAAFLEAVRRSMKAIRQVLGSTVIDPALLTCAERIQYEGFVRRREDSRGIKALAETGKSIKDITRATGRSTKLVRSVLRGGDGDVFRCRQSLLEPYVAKLRAEWDAGCRNGAQQKSQRSSGRVCHRRAHQPGPRAAQSAASANSATGAQVHTRLRSPYTLSTRFTGGQNFAAATKGSGKAA